MPGIEPIFVRLPPRDIAMAKFLFESYEGVGVVRTLDRRAAIVVVLVAADFTGTAREIVAWLQDHIDCEEVDAPADADDDWLLAALRDEEGE